MKFLTQHRRLLGDVLLTAVLVAELSAAWAANPPTDARLKIVDFEPSSVLQLTGFVGYHIHFEFAPDERFVNLGAGDTAAVDVGAEANHLFLKPRAPGPGTNLTILTNRHTYFIDFRALARAPRADEAVYSVMYRYPQELPILAGGPGGSVSNTAGVALSRPVSNRNYWFCGSNALRPVYAADDGLQLHLKFPAQAELPAIYVQSNTGEETIVNSHVEGDTVVIHRLAKRFVLRRGNEVACVVDRGSAERQQRADSGTVDPEILRTTREAQQ